MEQVTRSDGRTLLVGDIVASPSFNGEGTIKRIDRTSHGIQVTVSFKAPMGSSEPGVALSANREHAFTPNEFVAQRAQYYSMSDDQMRAQLRANARRVQ